MNSISHMEYLADFQRLLVNVSGKLIYTTYLTEQRIAFGLVRPSEIPIGRNGLSETKWRAVMSYYNVSEIPQTGDRLYNLVFARTNEAIGERYTITEMHRHPHSKTITLLLAESNTQ